MIRVAGDRWRTWRVTSSPFQPGHHHIHHQHVRVVALRQLRGFQPIAGLANYLELGLHFQQVAQALPHNGMVICQQYGYGHFSSARRTFVWGYGR